MSRTFNNSQKTFIWSRQKGKCGSCGSSLSDEVDIEYHHILNYKDGGASIVENAVMLCEGCHLHCHDYDFKKSVLIYRDEFKYANWEENSFYKGRKKGKEVEFTKKTLDKWDNQYKGTTTMQKDSYANHIKMLEVFREQLLALRRSMKVLRDNYKKQLDAMENAGFMDETVSPLKNKYQMFSLKVDEIERQLNEHNNKIEIQKEALDAIRAIGRTN